VRRRRATREATARAADGALTLLTPPARTTITIRDVLGGELPMTGELCWISSIRPDPSNGRRT